MFRSIPKRAGAINLTVLLAALVAHLGLVLPAPAQDTTKPAKKSLSLSSLSMEVDALQALDHFGFDKAQLLKLKQWAAQTVPQDKPRKAAKVSKEFREKLQQLHRALQDAKDDDLIEKLTEAVGELQDKENPVLDDRVEVTEKALKLAAELRRLLRPRQLASYLGQIADSLPDPLEGLLEALDEGRSLSEGEWKEQKVQIADDIGRSVAGLDRVKAKRVSDRVATLLTRARTLTKTEFQKQEADLEKAARDIVGNVTAEEVLKQRFDLDLANLLANPRLAQACGARLRLAVESKGQARRK
jgi:hypothetical protein